MRFFDCNASVGRPMIPLRRPAPTASDLLADMDRVGIHRAVVWHVAQRDCAVTTGNQLLAQAIAGHEDRLAGCWAILPPQTGELPPPEEFCAQMTGANVRALKAMPDRHRYLLRSESCGPLIEVMVDRRIPLLLDARSPRDWEVAYGVLAEYPELVCILGNMHTWGTDRWFRPLVDRYAHCYVELSDYILDGGVEAFVGSYGARQLLFGTGYPSREQGGAMLMVKHADISDEDKQAIAAGNLERILADVRL